LRLALFLGVLLVAGGCQGGSDGPVSVAVGPSMPTPEAPTEAERRAALDALDNVKRAVLDSAFVRLREQAFTRRVRTEALTPSGSVSAFVERAVRYMPQDGGLSRTVVARDSSGPAEAFAGGLDWARPASSSDGPANISRDVLPESPAYMEARTREAFHYRLLPDTTLQGRTAQVIAVWARPGAEGYDQNIRNVRLYVDRTSRQIVGVRLLRADRSALFREDSHLRLWLRPGPDGAWVPHSTRFQTRVDVIFRAPQAFRTTARYTYS
jgi:hypothetical protein